MSINENNLPTNWKRPDELIKLQRLQQKKKKLTARVNQNSNDSKQINNETNKTQLLEAKIAQKRKNPFAKISNDAKKTKTNFEVSDQEDSLLEFENTTLRIKDTFIRETPTKPPPANLVLKPFDAQSFSKLLQNSNHFNTQEDDTIVEEQNFTKHLPMDWSLKTRIRFFCPNELPSTKLKTSQIASGLTSFVRCIDTQNGSGSLDISPATRFNQGTYYWQHPHLPWMTLYPRTSKDNNGIVVGERERKALIEEWDHSFDGLFQLLRARQCPYFYLCANMFTVIFRAAGTGGCDEIHALMTSSTRGIRSALKQEGIEFSMPLKKESHTNANKSGDDSLSNESSCLGNLTNNTNGDISNEMTDSQNEEDEEEWLEDLGVDEKEIRRLRTAHSRKLKAKDMAEDFSESSLLLIKGVECQGFFSFLLNSKSIVSSIGKLAGVPPTLLAPVAFPKATMQHITTRSNKVRMEGVDYCSIEVKGVILPTFLPNICQLFGESKDTFSATLATDNTTLAFSKATQKMLEKIKQSDKELKEDTARQVFGQENLSDCGILPRIIESMCRTGQSAVAILERVCYNKEYGYAWS